MYTLIIKGDETAAFASCREHKVEITSIVKHERFDECIVTVPATVSERLLTDWLCETMEPPFVSGALVWWGPAKIDLPWRLDAKGLPIPQGWDKVEG